MTYPNAQKGLSRLFTAQILSLIGSVLLIITGLFAVSAAASAQAGASDQVVGVFGLGTIIGAIPGIILPIIALVLSITGLNTASSDSNNFRIAFYAAIVSLIVSLASGFLPELKVRGIEILPKIIDILGIVVFAYVVEGIKELGTRIGAGGLVSLANTIVKLYVGGMIGGIILEGFAGNPATSDTVGFLGLIALILIMAAQVLYIVLLGKAKKVFAQA